MEKEVGIAAVRVGLDTLCSAEVRVSAKDVEALAVFKELLRAILAGQLSIVSSNRVLPEGIANPKEDKKPEEKK